MNFELTPVFTDGTHTVSFIRKNSVNSTGARRLDVRKVVATLPGLLQVLLLLSKDSN